MGGACDLEIHAETTTEMVRKMTAHVMNAHPEVARRMENFTAEEHRRWEGEFHRNWDEAHKLAAQKAAGN